MMINVRFGVLFGVRRDESDDAIYGRREQLFEDPLHLSVSVLGYLHEGMQPVEETTAILETFILQTFSDEITLQFCRCILRGPGRYRLGQSSQTFPSGIWSRRSPWW